MLLVHFAWAFANGTKVAHDCVDCLAPVLPNGPFKYYNGGPERLLGQYGTFRRISPLNVSLDSVPVLRTVSPENHELGVAWFYIVPGATAIANLSSLKIYHAAGVLEQGEFNNRGLHDWMVEMGFDAVVRTHSEYEVPMQLVLLLKNVSALGVPCPDHDAIIDCVDYNNVAIGTNAVEPAMEPMCQTQNSGVTLVLLFLMTAAVALVAAFREARQRL
jgi:hypothetical protein